MTDTFANAVKALAQSPSWGNWRATWEAATEDLRRKLESVYAHVTLGNSLKAAYEYGPDSAEAAARYVVSDMRFHNKPADILQHVWPEAFKGGS